MSWPERGCLRWGHLIKALGSACAAEFISKAHSRAASGPHQGHIRAASGPHQGSIRATSGPDQGCIRASTGPDVDLRQLLCADGNSRVRADLEADLYSQCRPPSLQRCSGRDPRRRNLTAN